MSRQLSPFFDSGFHGDKYLIELVFAATRRAAQFIETGANVGSSLHYLATNFPAVACYSCEPDPEAFAFAQGKTSALPNVCLSQTASPDFLYGLLQQDPARADLPTVFWLDSHGYGFRWPLQQEVQFITREFKCAYVFIDDFKVPGQPQFLFDEYDGQVCAFESVAPQLRQGLRYNLYYPCYAEKTSQHHPLKGWGLIEFGCAESLEIPPPVQGKTTLLLCGIK
jgi:hypothetical protein